MDDTDRERVAHRLQTALDEGRISATEYDERLRTVLGARTRAELAVVTADLPQPQPDGTAAIPAPMRELRARARRTRIWTWLRWLWLVWFTVVLLNVVIWVLASVSVGEVVYFWPVWVGAPAGVVLFGLTIADHWTRDEG